jgi:hypothetical protein
MLSSDSSLGDFLLELEASPILSAKPDYVNEEIVFLLRVWAFLKLD